MSAPAKTKKKGRPDCHSVYSAHVGAAQKKKESIQTPTWKRKKYGSCRKIFK